MEPVLVPKTKSNTSQRSELASASTSFRTPSVYTPLEPPPSRDRTRNNQSERGSADRPVGYSVGVVVVAMFSKPRSRPAAHIVGARNFAKRFLAGGAALDRLLLLMMGERRLSAKPDGVRPALAGARGSGGSPRARIPQRLPAPLMTPLAQRRPGPLRRIHSVSRKKVPNARGPSPTGIFVVTTSVSVLIAQTSFENQLTM